MRIKLHIILRDSNTLQTKEKREFLFFSSLLAKRIHTLASWHHINPNGSVLIKNLLLTKKNKEKQKKKDAIT
jgi:hypothetical protein